MNINVPPEFLPNLQLTRDASGLLFEFMLKNNHSKIYILSLYDSIGISNHRSRTQLHRPITADCVPALGSYIGRDTATIAAELAGGMEPMRDCFAGVLAVASKSVQAANLLLRHCILTKPVHLLRTLRPSITDEFTREFDQEAHNCIIATLALPSPLSEEAQLDLSLPYRLGGMGFRPAARANRPAFWGSAASSLYFVLTETGLQDAEMSVVRERLTLVREIEVIHTNMLTVQNVVPDDIAIAQSFEATFNSFGGQEMANGLQKLLMKLVDDSLDRRRRYRAPRALIARANACKARGASAWLMTIPHPDYPELRISNLDFRLAVRHRMAYCHRTPCRLTVPVGDKLLTWTITHRSVTFMHVLTRREEAWT